MPDGKAPPQPAPKIPGVPVQEAFDLEELNRENLGRRMADPELSSRVEALLARLSLEQKIAQMHGESFDPRDELFSTRAEPELGLEGLRMVDGPRGARVGVATTFPVALARGATWNPALEARVGQAIAREARARGANMLLAPAVNLLRHPCWGRAQETYGEDALHVGRMGAAFIAGAQRELIASVKHFALNSIEDTRFHVDVQVDERTLHEIYLPHFELCVRGAHVGSVMSAYNKVNGRYCAENAALLRDTLKERWGFLGFVESDWVFGVHSTEDSLAAGLDLEMPRENYYGAALREAFRAGRVSRAELDEAVRRILRVKVAFGLAGDPPPPPLPPADVIESHEHQDLALRVAQQSFVLLKNRDDVLPLSQARDLPLAVVGALATHENTGDRGSSAVTSSFVITALEGIQDRLSPSAVRAIARDRLDVEDRATLRACRAAIVVVGLTWRDEGERIPLREGGGDRAHLRLSATQERLVREVAALVPRTIVVLEAGSAVEVRSFVDDVPALLWAWYPGMLGGEALSDVLLGTVCPSGKLPISIPRAGADLVPFDHRSHEVRYGYEHGYRQLERAARDPEYPFGFGLSYTTFRYDLLQLSHRQLEPGQELEVTVTVSNTGVRAGEEVVQIYLSAPESAHLRSPKWLAGFGRIALAPGESGALRLRVGERELRHFDGRHGRFEIERTRFIVRAGGSSRDLTLEAGFEVV